MRHYADAAMLLFVVIRTPVMLSAHQSPTFVINARYLITLRFDFLHTLFDDMPPDVSAAVWRLRHFATPLRFFAADYAAIRY